MTDDVRSRIQQQMASVRTEIGGRAATIIGQARALRDWRVYVDAAPVTCVAAAFTLGYLIVPSKPRVTIADAESLAALARHEQLAVTHRADKATTGAVAAGLLGWMARSLLQQGLRLAVAHVLENGKRR